MAQTPKEYFEQLCKEAGYSEADTTTLVALASNEKVSPKIQAVLKTAQDDYNAQVGRVRALDEEVAKQKAASGDIQGRYHSWWTDTLIPELRKRGFEVTDKGEVSFTPKNGNGAGDGMDPDMSKFMTREDFVKASQEQSSRFGVAMQDGLAIATSHVMKFKEPLDTRALDKFCEGKQFPSLEAAYNEYVRPRVEEQQKTQLEAQLKQAREEGAKDALSRHNLPVAPAPEHSAPIFTREKAVPIEALDQELLKTWHEAGAVS
jgi:hypothetical protein